MSRKEAEIAADGTICTYRRQGNSLVLTLWGEPGMPKQKREESETSEDPKDLKYSHVELATLDCTVTSRYVYVQITRTPNKMEHQKSYAKLLYLKLVKWCRAKGIKHITGYVTNKEALPLFIRESLPKVKNTYYISVEEKEQIQKLRKLGVKFKNTLSLYTGEDMMQVTNTTLTPEQLKALPCVDVDTTLL
jgi:hypothetical protein